MFKEKLKFLRGYLRKWNLEVFVYLNLEVDDTLKDLNDLDVVGADCDLVDVSNLASRRYLASSMVWNSIYFKESVLRQKAICLRLSERDSNSSFFLHKEI